MNKAEHIRTCTRCVMDTTAGDVRFDEQGRCNYCTDYINLLDTRNHFDDAKRETELSAILGKIQKSGSGKEYDCVLGVSGGMDSSYALYMAKKLGLRPLAVHLDNGWNSELAVSNIEKLVNTLNVDLYTHVINWDEFKNLQVAFFKANVVDIEMLTDHAITAILYKVAHEKDIKYLVAGTNIANEGMIMPPDWNHPSKMLDLKNIKAIYQHYHAGGTLKTFPMMGFMKYLKYSFLDGIRWVALLDYVRYRKEEAAHQLSRETGWRPYEKKHYESVFTRFYQGYILPKKFNVDKRKLHYSTLICSGQLSRSEAIESLKKDTYDDTSLLNQDKEFVLKKLGFSNEEFEKYMSAPPVPHRTYPSNEAVYNIMYRLYTRFIKKVLMVEY